MSSRCRQTLIWKFHVVIWRIRQRILLKCVPHVQHDYFSSLNQSDNCSLTTSLPMLSSLLKFPIITVKKIAKLTFRILALRQSGWRWKFDPNPFVWNQNFRVKWREKVNKYLIFASSNLALNRRRQRNPTKWKTHMWACRACKNIFAH